MDLFRQEAIEGRRRRLWGEVRINASPSLTVWTCVLGGICVAVFLVLIFASYTRKETVQGFLAPEAGVIQVRAGQGGRITAVHVTEGQLVEKGAPLFEFASDIGAIGRGPAYDLQLAQTRIQLEAIESRKQAASAGLAVERTRLAEQIQAQTRQREIAIRQRTDQADALAISEADLARMAALLQRGYASQTQLDQRRRAVLSERSALSDLDFRISQGGATISELNSQISTLRSRQDEVVAQLASEAAGLAQRLTELEVARSSAVYAPVAGRVSNLQARVGMTPNPDQPLMSMAPKGSKLVVYLLVPTRAAGFLEVGQNVKLQIDAYPFQRFGFLEGTVSDIGGTVVRPGDIAFPIEQLAPAYQIRADVSEAAMTVYGKRRPLQSGMAVTADIPIDRRKLWQQLFEPMIAAGRRTGF